MPRPGVVLPVDGDLLLIGGRLEFEREGVDGPFPADGGVAEGVGLSLAKKGEIGRCESGFFREFAPGSGDG